MKTVTRKHKHEDESEKVHAELWREKKTHDITTETWRDVMQDRQTARP